MQHAFEARWSLGETVEFIKQVKNDRDTVDVCKVDAVIDSPEDEVKREKADA